MSCWRCVQVGRPGPDGAVVLPAALPLASERLDIRGAFLLDDGLRLVLWLGKALPPEYLHNILGPEAASLPDYTQVHHAPRRGSHAPSPGRGSQSGGWSRRW